MAAVLGLLAIIGLLSVGALHDALFGEQLAGSRLLHQRATALAEAGIENGIVRSADPALHGLRYSFEPLEGTTDSATVTIDLLAESDLAEGFSSGRFRVRHLSVGSTSHTVRGVSVTLTQGISRVVAAGGMPSPEAEAP